MKLLLRLLPLLFVVSCVRTSPTPPPVPVEPTSIFRAVNTPKPCQDILSLAVQDRKMIKENLREGEGIGVMAGTFGEIKKSLRELLLTGKVDWFRIHLGGFCSHGAKCYPGECATNNLECLRTRARTAQDLKEEFPNVECNISPYAEYAEKNKDKVMGWFRTIHDAAPGCDLVASAFGGYIPPGVKVEKHGNNPGNAAITSNDGSNYFDSDSVTYNTIASERSCKWTNRYNRRLTSEKGPPPPPKERPASNNIQKNDFIQMQLMELPLEPMPKPPAVCKGIKKFTGRDLLKTHGEDYGENGDARSNKPLLITRNGPGNLDVYNAANKKIGCFKYYGPYVDRGYNRHYMGSCSGDDAYTLYIKAKSEWAFVKEGNLCRPITVMRRMGYFRD